MQQVAKLLLVDPDDQILLLYRDAHPIFGDDPDLPGGTWEEGEELHETVQREVQEEIGVHVDASGAVKIYEGTTYSSKGMNYVLFRLKIESQPPVTLSHEHASYHWLTMKDFLQHAQVAKDSYMKMVVETIKTTKLL